jgi:predicted anti-sigma-YlaC factor YlaD
MRCDEIQERFIDLLYSECGTPSASPELQAHIESCPVCREELEGLKEVQKTLRRWEDEPALRPVEFPRPEHNLLRTRPYFWRAVRYAAIAAMLVIAFLAVASPEITWSKQGFSFKTNTPWSAARADSYTKAETRNLLKQVIDDSEARVTETNYLMMQRLLDTIEQDRMSDLRMVKHQVEQNRNKN